MANFNEIYPNIARWENGFGNSSADSGNYCDGVLVGTNRGISAILYKGVYGKCPTPTEMKNLSYESAKRIWKERFFDALDLQKLKSNELAELYIFTIGGGSSGNLHVRQSANKILGKNKFPESRSKLTKEELDVIHDLNETKMFNTLYDTRVKFFTDHYNAGFVRGWLRRMEDIKQRFKPQSKATGLIIPLGFLGFGLALLSVYFYKKLKNKK